MSKERESPFKLMKALITNSAEWKKKNLSDAVYWLKIFLSTILGFICGFLKLTGSIGNILFGVIVLGVIHFLVTSFLKIDVENILGSTYGVVTEGLLPAYSIFVLTWSLIYTLLI